MCQHATCNQWPQQQTAAAARATLPMCIVPPEPDCAPATHSNSWPYDNLMRCVDAWRAVEPIGPRHEQGGETRRASEPPAPRHVAVQNARLLVAITKSSGVANPSSRRRAYTRACAGMCLCCIWRALQPAWSLPRSPSNCLRCAPRARARNAPATACQVVVACQIREDADLSRKVRRERSTAGPAGIL